MGLAIQLNAIAWLELAAPLGLLKPVHPHLTALDALLGFTTGERHPLPFEELIEANRLGSVASGAGTWRWGQKKR
jgi:hypothetical protein